MAKFMYYQLVTLDGMETPYRFSRQGLTRDDVWSPELGQWVPTKFLLRMLIHNEVALDRIDYDPVAAGRVNQSVQRLMTPGAPRNEPWLGSDYGDN